MLNQRKYQRLHGYILCAAKRHFTRNQTLTVSGRKKLRLNDWTFTWQRTADGRGRIYRPSEGFRGSIELIGRDDLLRDAGDRNQAFFDGSSLKGVGKSEFEGGSAVAQGGSRLA